jgi:FAD/FMN-containing dehydrogenase
VNVAVLAVDSFEKVQTVFHHARLHLAEILSAFEFWDNASQKLTLTHLTHVRNPLSSSPSSSSSTETPSSSTETPSSSTSTETPFYVLLETSGSQKDHDDDKLTVLLESMMEEGVVSDGVLAQDSAQVQSMWALREGIPEACSKAGAVYKVFDEL